jgi:hypothetical protein
MEINDLIEGDSYQGILLETYVPQRVTRPGVRPISVLPQNVKVEFPRKLRTEHPIGTRFSADVKVCQKHSSDGTPKGNKYLRADTKSISIVGEFIPQNNLFATLDPNSIGDRSYNYIVSTKKNEERLNHLRELACKGGTDLPELKTSEIITRKRKDIVKAYAHVRSKGICEACDSSAPFISKNSEPYLEVHHIEALSEGGLDHPCNVAAICPNCHRRIEHGMDGEEINKSLEEKIQLLENQSN